jgi:hypothetical protein
MLFIHGNAANRPVDQNGTGRAVEMIISSRDEITELQLFPIYGKRWVRLIFLGIIPIVGDQSHA